MNDKVTPSVKATFLSAGTCINILSLSYVFHWGNMWRAFWPSVRNYPFSMLSTNYYWNYMDFSFQKVKFSLISRFSINCFAKIVTFQPCPF